MKTFRRAHAAVMASLPLSLARSAAKGFRRGLLVAREARGLVLSFRPAGRVTELALVLADLRAFKRRDGDRPRLPPPTREPHWRAVTLVRLLLDLGYAVDVMADHERVTPPAKPYALVVAPPHVVFRSGPSLSPDCLRVLHVNTADTLFQNAAELQRLVDIKERRGMILAPVRYRPPSPAVRQANCLIVQGNDFTVSTYRHANKPLYEVPVVSGLHCASPAAKDFEASRGRFLWIGDRALVAKGLDLVLEAFVGMPGYHLDVSGPLPSDRRFTAAYARELYETSNIHRCRWTDLSRVARRAASTDALILPSSAEGQAREVVAAMHCGLIPVVSREAGVDVDDFGVVLNECSVAAIQEATAYLAGLPVSRRREMAMGAWQGADRRHSPAAVTERYRQILLEITAGHRPPARGVSL